MNDRIYNTLTNGFFRISRALFATRTVNQGRCNACVAPQKLNSPFDQTRFKKFDPVFLFAKESHHRPA